MVMIERKEYMNQLRALRDEPIIKVVTGIRRCGKSTLLDMFREELLKSGVAKEQIIAINFEDEKFADLTNRRALYQYLSDQFIAGKKNYIFLDEVQNVEEFERVVDSFYIQPNVDIYITGSNAYLLSSELATLLSGRYIEISMLPFSFKEYVESLGERTDYGVRLGEYLESSSFPYAVRLENKDSNLINQYLRNVYDSVYVKDIMTRKQIKNERAFENVLKFVLGSVGSSVSPNSVAASLSVDDKTIANRTVETYLKALSDSFILYPVGRFDIRGKQQLRTQEKYYVVDLGLRRIFLGKEKDADRGHLLENVVYLELLRRGGEVFIGKVDSNEVDFIVKNNDGTISYYQVAYTAKESRTMERELKPLRDITDNYPKYLLTTDEFEYDESGMQILNVGKWLLGSV